MASDAIQITQQVLDHLKRLGIVVPHVAGEVSTDEYFELWRTIAAADARPDLGISIGLALFGRSVASIAAVQAPTVADAIRTIGRYKRLVCPEEVILELGDGEGSLRFDGTAMFRRSSSMPYSRRTSPCSRKPRVGERSRSGSSSRGGRVTGRCCARTSGARSGLVRLATASCFRRRRSRCR
jgi:hypothetical protein